MKIILIFCFLLFNIQINSQNQKNHKFFLKDSTTISVQKRKMFKKDHVTLVNDDGSQRKLYYSEFYRYEYDEKKTGLSNQYIHKVKEFVCLKENTVSLLSVIAEGKCKLYTSIGTYGPNLSGNHYYIKRDNEKFATKIGSTDLVSKNFKKVAQEYFKDCPIMEEKIKIRFRKKRKRLLEIVNFYNDNCN